MLIVVPCSACGARNHVQPRAPTCCCNCRGPVAVPPLDLSRSGKPPPGSPTTGAHPSGPKRAVVCGISYSGELGGCVGDAHLVKKLLMEHFHFPESSIVFLTDEDTTYPDTIPTKENIMEALRWMVEGSQPGDSLVFHFSGHGGQREDNDGDELDGLDEYLCPLDYEEGRNIVDDEINEVLVNPLPRGAKLHAIIDACHSGTSLDLPYLCRMNRSGQYEWEDHRPQDGSWKGTDGGEVITFSGCDDHQWSQETSMITGGNALAGALTYSFVEAISKGGETLTYGGLLNSMRRLIRTAHNMGPNRTSFKLDDGYSQILMQEPQLTSDEEFDVYEKSFSL